MEVLDLKRQEDAEDELLLPPSTDGGFIFPVSYAQKGLWLMSRFEPRSAAYNIPAAFRLTGSLDVDVLERSLNEIVQRHESLRTTFEMIEERLVQVVHPVQSLLIESVELGHLPEGERAERVGQLAQEHAQEPFDLSRWPLIRVKLLRLAEAEHVLLLSMHHIIGDGWSTGVFVSEMAAIYKSFSAGQPSPLAELSLQYADFALWQEEWLSGEVLETHLAYWRQQLAGAPPVLELPADRPRPAIESFRGAHYSFQLSEHLTAMLKELSRKEGATLFMTLLAGFQTLLYRYTGQQDIVVGSPIANRNRAETEQLIGFFVNTLVLRTKLEGNPRFNELLKTVREMTLGAYMHQDLPFERLVEELQPKRDLSRSPIFQVMFILQNAPTSTLELSGVTLSALEIDNKTSKFDLMLSMEEEAEGSLSGTLEYNTDLFDATTIRRIANHFEAMLESIVAAPQQRIDDLPLLTSAEREQVLEKWNETVTDFPEDNTFHQLFEKQVERTPDAVAIVFEEQSLNYSELNERANQLAHHLRSLGVGPESLVGICLERSIEMVVALLGVLKAGAAYVPLDPAYPQQRLAFVLADSQAQVLLTQQHLLSQLPSHDRQLQVLCLDTDWELISTYSTQPLTSLPTSANLAYTIYTSGSTGQPKGVQISHRALVNFLTSMQAEPGMTATDTLLSVTTLSFDIAALELYLPLMTGARLVIVSRETAVDGRALARAIEDCQATIMQATPATWRLLLEAQWAGSDQLKVLCGGEALSSELAQKLIERCASLWNMYGPTETTIWSLLKQVDVIRGSVVEIGRPIANTRAYVLNASLQPVPVRGAGEIYLGGEGLARGYLNRPELTAERFIPDQFSGEVGARLYRTGDLGRYLPDGQIEFLGRVDQQVKIRGHRIELGEIEAALSEHPAVGEAVVVAREEAEGDKRLMAYLVTGQAADVVPSVSTELTEQLTEQHAELTSQWQMAWDQTYSQESEPADPSLNLSGWNSSYTGSAIPAQEMREWVEQTVERILSLQPERVLEIGCGMGLLLSRIAPECEQYCATDFSPTALNYVEQLRAAQNLSQVTLLQRSAEDFTGLEAGAFDTVVINSVIQYFPDVNYLLNVLEGVVKMVKPGGSIFLGDVRSLPSLEALHTSIQLHHAPPDLPVSQLRQQIQKGIFQEEELVVAPAFFHALKHHLPNITEVEVRHKRGRYHNELSRFRYDVLLKIEGKAPLNEDCTPLNWKKQNLSLPAVQAFLASSQPQVLHLTDVPNARCEAEHKMVELLATMRAEATAGELRAALPLSLRGDGVEPEDFWALSESLPYFVEVLWNDSSKGDFYDVVFRRRDSSSTETIETTTSLCQTKNSELKPWNSYVNNPLQGKFAGRLVPQLRSYLEEKLPSYMIPSGFILLPQMPLTPNGKVDRSELARMKVSTAITAESYVAPRNETEEIVAAIWAEVLGLSQVSVLANFFELGGHSLRATQVISRLHKSFGVELPLRSLFEAPTVAGLSEKIGAAQREEQSEELTPIRRIPREENRFALSFAQQRLWLLHQLQLDDAAYNVPMAVRLTGQLDIRAFEHTLSEIVGRHEVLRTTFVEFDGQPVQVINPAAAVALPIIDLSDLEDGEREAEAQRFITAEAGRSFDLTEGPLLRAWLLRLSEQEHIALMIMHHIVIDAWSLGLLIREVAALYAAYAQGQASPLPELSIQYVDFAHWQQQWLQGEALETQLSYWKKQLAGAPAALELPTDRPRPAVQTQRGAQESFWLSTDLARALNELSRREGVTLFMTLLAAWQVLLSRYTSQKDIVVGTDVANRNLNETEDLVGFFSNMLVLRSDLSGNPRFSSLLQRVREICLNAYAHQNAPFERLVEELQPKRDLSRSPIFQVMFILQNAPTSALELAGVTLSPLEVDNKTSKFDLILFIQEETEGYLSAKLEYNTDLFNASTVARIANHFATLLESIVAAPQQHIDDLPLLTSAERNQLLEQWNSTAKCYPEDTCLQDLFEEQAARTPHAVAVQFEDEVLTYAELSERSNQLAHHLRELGVKAETLVGICAERSVEMMVGLLGILKAGAAYVPLDPAFPRERLAFMLEDSRVEILLTQQSLSSELPTDGLNVVCLDTDWPDIARHSRQALPSLSTPGNLAYTIYTSGSTGQPKGVQISHRALVNFLTSMQAEPGMTATDTLLSVTTLSFDIAALELYLPLMTGARLVIISRETAVDGRQLAKSIAECGATLVQATPATWRLLLESQWKGDDRLKVLCGGEALGGELAQRLLGRCASLWNMYGPTETTIWSALKRVESAGAGVVEIGRPIANTQLYILDSYMQPVPVGVAGELYIGGDGLARGYLGRPELTSERFVPDAFSSGGGRRLYRTGDMARYLPDGEVEFLGRADHQVKIRGHRIELGEIEAALAQHPSVGEAVVVAREEAEGDKRLVAYLVSGGSGASAAEGLEIAEQLENLTSQWQMAWDETYADEWALADPTFNISGWNSSYTGEPIPAAEMREWVEQTVGRILGLRPARVLEIGCGTGLLLFRVAPHSQYYCGTDFSPRALAYIQRQLERAERQEQYRHVALRQGSADSLGEIEAEGFDTIILNSVVQYFPDVDYLARVLREAVGAVGAGGRVFVGDVRSLRLLEAFHASVELSRAPSELSAHDLRQRVRQQVLKEKELCLDPSFFEALAQHLPGVSRVEVQLKRGHSDNELTRFRYDVTLHVGNPAPLADAVGECSVSLDWAEHELTLASVRQLLVENRPDSLVVKRVPNARLLSVVKSVKLLAGAEAGTTVAALREAVSATNDANGINPEEVWGLVDGTPYTVEVGWSEAGADDSFDLLFRREEAELGQRSGEIVRAVTAKREEVTDWHVYANNPLRGVLTGSIEPRLRGYLQEKLPSYMIPSAFVLLPEMPLTPNGKVDRRELSRIDPGASASESSYTAPRTPTEEAVAAIWAEVLGLTRVGVQSDFFGLGGHSLRATQVISRLHREYGVELPLRSLFESPTVEALSQKVDEALTGGHSEELAAIARVAREGVLPVSFAQQRLWFIHQLEPTSASYNIPVAVRLSGDLDVAALEQTWSQIVRRHEVLRTTFGIEAGEPVQIIHPASDVTITVRDLSMLPEGEREAEAQRLAAEQAQQPFDLARGPLQRTSLIRLGEEDHLLLLTMHHIISDGWSIGVLIREVAALYEAFTTGRQSPLPELKVQYADFAAWQREWLQGGALEDQISYWKQQLADAAVLELPTDHPRPPVQTFRGAQLSFSLPEQLSDSLKTLTQGEGVTLFMTLLAAFQTLLHRYSGQHDILVGTPIAGRTRAETEDLIGFFVNTLVLRSDLSVHSTFRELLGSVRETTLQAYAHQDVPFEKLVEELQPGRDLSRQPLFQVMLVLQNTQQPPLQLPGLRLSAAEVEGKTAKFDLTLSVEEREQGLLLGFEYNIDLFEAETIRRMAEHFRMLLESVVADLDQPLSMLSLLSADEREQILVGWNETGVEYAQDKSLHQLFEEQVERTPEAIAVVFEDEQVSYAELNAKANQLAHHLQQLGVAPDTLVGILMHRSVEMVVALLAVLKAGGAYLPLDPEYPEERLSFMLRDAAVTVLLTQQQVAAQHTFDPNAGVPVVALDEQSHELALLSTQNLTSSVSPDNLAYVIYTSGSTGSPKAAMNSHLAISNRLLWMQDAFSLSSSDAVLQKTPFTFDVSVWEFFWPLITGARLVVARPAHHADASYLASLIEQQQVTVLHFVPSMLSVFLEEQDLRRRCSSVREVMSSGEALPAALVRRYYERMPGQLWNLYGPTEAAVDVSWWRCPEGEEIEEVPIGRPIANMQLYILDGHGQVVPVGVAGELHIGGVGLGRGYLNRPEMTAERFVPHPFSEKPGERLYRTGDLTRYRADGEIEYIGRIDHQIKLRGYRIELGEIEQSLRQHERVQEAVVLVREDEPNDRRLVAYLVAKEDGELSSSELRGHLQQKLPDYMIPSAFMQLDRMPLTPNGKLDRRALPVPDRSGVVQGREFVAPHTAVEEMLAGIWTQVLRVERVSVHDNFFDLGGHSLLATQVIARIRDAFQQELPLRALFEDPTIAALSQVIEQQRLGQSQIEARTITPVPRDGHLPLSFGQQRLWFLEQLEPGSPLYNCPGAAHLRGNLDIEALEASLNEIIRRHESLRTRFATLEGEPVQIISDEWQVRLAVEEISAGSEAERAAEIERLAEAEARQGFDLAQGPLLRVKLLRLSADEHVVFFTMHHIISDAWSLGVFLNELAALYEAHRRGVRAELPELTIQYADYAVWQREYLSGEVLEQQVGYWTKQLAGAPVLELPSDRPRPDEQTHRGAQQAVELSAGLSEQLRVLSRHEGVTLYMTLLAAFDVLLHYYTGQRDIVVGTNVSNRDRRETEQLIGFFVNQLAMRVNLSGDPTFRELLQQVREVTLDAYANQEIPFDRLVEALRLERNLSRAPLFQVKIDLLNTLPPDLSGTELSITPLMADTGGSHLDLIVSLANTQSELTGLMLYNTDLFDVTTVVRIFNQFESLLAHVVAQPDARLSALTEALAGADKQRARNQEEGFRKSRSEKLKNLRRGGASARK